MHPDGQAILALSQKGMTLLTIQVTIHFIDEHAALMSFVWRCTA